MRFNRKEWKDQIAEFTNRFRLTQLTNGLYNIVRDWGNITQIGNKINAEEMNDLEERIAEADASINDALNELDDSVDSVKLNVTQNTKRIDNIEELLTNHETTFITDSSDAYLKDVPSNSGSVGALLSIGGKTVKSKNLFNPTLQTATFYGVTYNRNSDNTYTLNGTASAINYLNIGTVNSVAGKQYRVVGGYSSGIRIRIADSGNTWIAQTGVEGSVTFTSRDNLIRVDIVVESGEVCNNIVIKPMITEDLSATINDYEPYYEGLRHASVDDVISRGEDFEKHTSLPSALLDLPCYGSGVGDVYNEVDYVNKKYIQRVDEIDLGDFSFTVIGYTKGLFFSANILNLVSKRIGARCITSKYKTNASNLSADLNDMEYSIDSNGYFQIRNDAYIGDSNGLKQSLVGQKLVFELATPRIFDITDILENFDNLISTEPNGQLEFHNTNDMPIDVPSEVKWMVAL